MKVLNMYFNLFYKQIMEYFLTVQAQDRQHLYQDFPECQDLTLRHIEKAQDHTDQVRDSTNQLVLKTDLTICHILMEKP